MTGIGLGRELGGITGGDNTFFYNLFLVLFKLGAGKDQRNKTQNMDLIFF